MPFSTNPGYATACTRINVLRVLKNVTEDNAQSCITVVFLAVVLFMFELADWDQDDTQQTGCHCHSTKTVHQCCHTCHTNEKCTWYGILRQNYTSVRQCLLVHIVTLGQTWDQSVYETKWLVTSDNIVSRVFFLFLHYFWLEFRMNVYFICSGRHVTSKDNIFGMSGLATNAIS